VSELLFRATQGDRPVVIGRATTDEVSALAGPVGPAAVRDDIDRWNLIAIRDPLGRGTQIHTLGWRRRLGNTWITSPIVRIDATSAMVSTSSAHSYALGEPNDADIDPDLAGHLLYALRTWGLIGIERAS
jgi:hypothetical protein